MHERSVSTDDLSILSTNSEFSLHFDVAGSPCIGNQAHQPLPDVFDLVVVVQETDVTLHDTLRVDVCARPSKISSVIHL